MLDILKTLPALMKSGEELQANFSPDFLLRASAAAAKKWFIEQYLNEIDEVSQEWGKELSLDPAQAKTLALGLLDLLRRKF